MRRRGWLVVLGLAVAVAVVTSCVSGKEFRCDESVAHLKDCCPEFDRSKISCDEDLEAIHNGGGGPDIGAKAADCLLDRSCDEIRARDICTRLGTRVPSASTPDGSVQEISCAP